MTDRYRQRPYPPEESDGTSPHAGGVHPPYAPGRGYTPPLGSPPPPKNFFGRVVYSVQNYFGLQRRARASSMQWWLLKFVQGLIFATPPGIIGVGLVIGGAVSDDAQCISGIGKGLVLLSALIFLWYALAPITLRWRVMIPEGQYWAVEDSNYYTLDFLRGGPQAVDWHWNAHIVKYVDFTRVAKSVRVDGVLIANNQRLSLELHIVMHLDPTRAPEANYPELRKMTRPELFEHQIDRYVRRVVLDTLQRRADRLYLLTHPSELEDVVQWSLDELAEWGLLPVAGRPVSVQVISVPLPGMGTIPQAAMPPEGYAYDGPHQREVPTQPGTGPIPAQSAGDPAPDADTVISGAGTASGSEPVKGDVDHTKDAHDQRATQPATDEELVDPLDRRREKKKKRRGES